MDPILVKQEGRICNSCGKRFLSGVAHFERGYLKSMLCYVCAEDSLGCVDKEDSQIG